MPSRLVVFDHASPALPTLTKGAHLTAAGIAPPSPSFMGNLAGIGASNDMFGDGFGQGQMACDSSGRIYVCDTENNKEVKRFVWNSSTRKFEYDSKVNTTSALGSAVKPICLEIYNGTLYLAAYDQNASGTWIRYWNNFTSLWPTLTVANSSGAFGSNTTGSDSSGVLGTGATLSIGMVEGVLSALATGVGSNRRVILWKVSDGTVTVQAAPAGFTRYRHAIGSDGKLYGGNIAFSGALPGLHEISAANLTSSVQAFFDSYSFSTTYWQRKNRASATGGNGFIAGLIEHDGVLYVRETNPAILHAWLLSDRSYLKQMLRAGFDESDSVSNCIAGPNQFLGTQIQGRLGSHLGTASMPDHLLFWAWNSPNDAVQAYIKAIPTSVSTATWSYSGPWHADGSTLNRIFADGLSAKQGRVRVSKNGGVWVTKSLAEAASDGAFGIALSGSDTLDVQLLLSTFYDLSVYDPNEVTLATKRSAESPFTPTDCRLISEFTEGDVLIPYASSSFKGSVGGTGAYQGQIGG